MPLSAVAALVAIALAADGGTPAPALPADTRILRLSDHASVSWVLPPAPAKVDCLPLLDRGGAVWLSCEHRFLIGATREAFFELEQPVDAIAWLDDGQVVAAVGPYLSRVRLDAPWEREDGQTIAALQSFTRTPYASIDLSSAAGGGFYLVGHGGADGGVTDTVLRWEPGASGWTETTLLTVAEPITAVAGDGQTTFVAAGRTIVSFGPGDRSPKVVLQHASGEITALAFSREIGLFYATAKVVGFAGSGLHLDFIATPNARLRARGSSLYVTLRDGGGTLQLGGLDFFRAFDEAALKKAGKR